MAVASVAAEHVATTRGGANEEQSSDNERRDWKIRRGDAAMRFSASKANERANASAWLLKPRLPVFCRTTATVSPEIGMSALKMNLWLSLILETTTLRHLKMFWSTTRQKG